MDDFYELLDLDRQSDSESITQELRKQNKTFKGKAQRGDSAANQRLDLIRRATAVFENNEKRATYDKELAEAMQAKEFDQPIADVDYYDLLGLPMVASVEQIQRRADELEKEGSADSDIAERRKRVIQNARDTLLNPETKTEYDKLVAAKKAYDQKKLKEQPIPLLVGATEVSSWTALESVLDSQPDTGLFLLKDGEIEAWVRWSLGLRQRAEWVKDIGDRIKASDTPFLEFDELQRLVNPARPLVLYDTGERSGTATPPPTICTLMDIVTLADKNWTRFLKRLDRIFDWVAVYGDAEVISNLNAIGAARSPSVQLERLIGCIDPMVALPQSQISGLTGKKIDFGKISKWDKPVQQFELQQSGRGYLYGTASANTNWLMVEPKEFEGAHTTFKVTIDRLKLSSGTTSTGQVTLNLLDGRIPPLVMDVSIEQRTVVDSIGNIFKRKKNSDE